MSFAVYEYYELACCVMESGGSFVGNGYHGRGIGSTEPQSS